MATLGRAIEIAAWAHAGQRDKAGQPYIQHPLRMMMKLRTEHERIVAVLHDVVEDHPDKVTFDDLVREGFPAPVIEALRALTKRDGESRLDAARRALRDPIARVVKLADVTDNLDISRIAHPTPADADRMAEYRQVRDLLTRGMRLDAARGTDDADDGGPHATGT